MIEGLENKSRIDIFAQNLLQPKSIEFLLISQ